jgi:hypothetical protein
MRRHEGVVFLLGIEIGTNADDRAIVGLDKQVQRYGAGEASMEA